MSNTLSINKEVCEKNGLNQGEALLLAAISYEIDLDKARQGLIEKGLITAHYDENQQKDGWQASQKGNDLIGTVIVESSKCAQSTDRLTALATKLKEIFPKGKKPGSGNKYWSEGVALIADRLNKFFFNYGNFTDEQVIDATRRYVNSFQNDKTYMRTLKYFIMKSEKKTDGIDRNSDLLTYIENAGEEEKQQTDWVGTLFN